MTRPAAPVGVGTLEGGGWAWLDAEPLGRPAGCVGRGGSDPPWSPARLIRRADAPEPGEALEVAVRRRLSRTSATFGPIASARAATADSGAP